MSHFELDPSKLLGQEIRLCVERSRADENEFDDAEEEAIYWLIYERVRHLGLRKHKMFGHIMLCLMPIAAATDDLDDLDELIQEVAEWLSQFKSLAVMAKLAKINSEFMELRTDGQTDIPADRLKFYQAVQSRSSLFTTLQASIVIFSLEEDAVCIHVPWDDGLACTLAHDIFVEQSDGDDDDDDDDDDDGGSDPRDPAPQCPQVALCT